MKRPHWFRSGFLTLLVIQSGCALLPQPEVHPPAEPLSCVTSESGALPDAERFRIDGASLVIHTYRAGWLSWLAHNHVMETDAIQGDLRLTDPIENSTATLCFRPWDLVLDDPDTRAAAGAGFESKRDEKDIAATRTRMLGPAGFHSNLYPAVRADVRWHDAGNVALMLHFRDQAIALQAPVVWQRTEDGIQVTADFQLSHRDLGVRPYSAFAGAIAVADTIRVQLHLSARAERSL